MSQWARRPVIRGGNGRRAPALYQMEVPVHREPDLTVKEVAELLKIHPETVRIWVNRGYFPNAYQLPGRNPWRIPVADVEELKRRGRPDAT